MIVSYVDQFNVTIFSKLSSACVRSHFIAKAPAVPPRQAYNNAMEFSTLTELDNIATDVDAMRIQSLLICERILGVQHTDTVFRLMFR